MIDRSAIAFTKNPSIYDRNRALHRYVQGQRDRHRSYQIITIDTRQNENATIGRTKAENPRCSAQKKGNLRRHETLTDRSLQAFLAAFAVREWARSGIRYNLKKATQVGTRSLQLTRKPLQTEARSLRATKCSLQLIDDQARSFWQWIEPPPDLPNSGVYERNRALHHKILRQRDRHKSDQIITIDTRQNENVSIGHRCSLKKAAQVGTRSLQLIDDQARSFWQWFEQPSDLSNSGVYERDRALHHKILRQRDRYRSSRSATSATSQNENATIGQDEPEYAPSSRKYAVRTKRETLTGRGLRAFMPALSVRTWNAIAHRYSLEKPLQTEARTLRATKCSTQATGYRGRSFWRRIEPFPDLPIALTESAAFLKKGGAL